MSPKPKIQLFPDYCSSGLWCGETGVNLDIEDLGLSEESKFLLQTWQMLFDRSPIQWEPEDTRWVYAEAAIEQMGSLVYLSVSQDLSDRYDVLYGQRLEEFRFANSRLEQVKPPV